MNITNEERQRIPVSPSKDLKICPDCGAKLTCTEPWSGNKTRYDYRCGKIIIVGKFGSLKTLQCGDCNCPGEGTNKELPLWAKEQIRKNQL